MGGEAGGGVQERGEAPFWGTKEKTGRSPIFRLADMRIDVSYSLIRNSPSESEGFRAQGASGLEGGEVFLMGAESTATFWVSTSLYRGYHSGSELIQQVLADRFQSLRTIMCVHSFRGTVFFFFY